MFNTAGKRLIMEDGTCTGVQCEGDGVLDVKAKAVIVATGGFLGNVDMMPSSFGTFVNPLGNVLSVGEGIDMVQAAGGQLSTQWGIAGNEFTGSNQKADGLYERKQRRVHHRHLRHAAGEQPGPPLLERGQVRESAAGARRGDLAGGRQVLRRGRPGLRGRACLRHRRVDAVRCRRGELAHRHDDAQGQAARERAGQHRSRVGAGWVFKADTIEALAEAIGAPELVETLDEYNGYCADGNDEQFYKPACFLQPVATGPFYAMQYEPSAWVTIGGIRTNDRLQAIDGEGVAIPGLYVAGADNGTLMSAPYCDYEGYSLMCAYCGGRMAGMYAAEAVA